jgi:hypothetical protein
MRTVVFSGLFSDAETRELLAALQRIETRHPSDVYVALVSDDDDVFDELQRVAAEGPPNSKHHAWPRLLV